MSALQPLQPPLLADVRQLIDAARQGVAQAVNAELTQLYWQIGRRISTPHANPRTAFPSLRAKRGNPYPHSHGASPRLVASDLRRTRPDGVKIVMKNAPSPMNTAINSYQKNSKLLAPVSYLNA